MIKFCIKHVIHGERNRVFGRGLKFKMRHGIEKKTLIISFKGNWEILSFFLSNNNRGFLLYFLYSSLTHVLM